MKNFKKSCAKFLAITLALLSPFQMVLAGGGKEAGASASESCPSEPDFKSILGKVLGSKNLSNFYDNLRIATDRADDSAKFSSLVRHVGWFFECGTHDGDFEEFNYKSEALIRELSQLKSDDRTAFLARKDYFVDKLKFLLLIGEAEIENIEKIKEKKRRLVIRERVKTIEVCQNAGLIEAFNRVKDYDEDGFSLYFSNIIDFIRKRERLFEDYKQRRTVSDLYAMLTAMVSCDRYTECLDRLDIKAIPITDINKFKEATALCRALKHGVGVYSRCVRLHSKPTSGMLERTLGICKQIEGKFGGIESETLRRVAKVAFWDFIENLRKELEFQLSEIHKKTPEEKAEKHKRILAAYPADQRFIPYALPGERPKVFASVSSLSLFWDRKNNRKVLIKRSQMRSLDELKCVVERLEKIDCSAIPKTEFLGDEGIAIEYIPRSMPLCEYARIIQNDRKGLLELYKQALEGISKFAEVGLDCPEEKSDHLLVDENGKVKFIDIDEPFDDSDGFFQELCFDSIIGTNAWLKAEFRARYNGLPESEKTFSGQMKIIDEMIVAEEAKT